MPWKSKKQEAIGSSKDRSAIKGITPCSNGSDSGFLDDADYQGDEVDYEAVKCGDKIHFDSTPDNFGRDINVILDKIGHL